MLWDSYSNIPTSLLNGTNRSKVILGLMHTSEPPANISRTQYRELVSREQLKRTTSDGLPIAEVIATYHTTTNGLELISNSEGLQLGTELLSLWRCDS